MRRLATAMLLVGLVPVEARGEGSGSTQSMGADLWRVQSGGTLTVDGGLVQDLPTALGPGLSNGFGIGVTRGHLLAWGARASWSTATESSIPWTVTQSDLRLRLVGVIQHTVGRARVGLRFGVGPTIVHETRLRNGSALETSAFSTLPAGEVEALVAVHIFGPWLFDVSGGPSAAVDGGSLRDGWVSLIGVGWQP
ncbi:MAG TPA: hypothetical protein VFG23_02195 [Polyangia bacterium]|nr:hypothetical protein [Polyangia bacterium]